jgi:D-glycero-alpha-D-manno-heptose-7-phosphate kinase
LVVIIVQTPLRVSFFGGGTDFPGYFHAEGGCVLTSAIDKYIFVTIKKRFDPKLRIGYTQTEMVDRVDEIQHELVRESLRKTGIRQGVEITTMGDLPSASGLGSSSTVTVGALHAMYAFIGEMVPAQRLASEACEIEIEVLGKPIGIQDQYIAALGGLRFFEFTPEGKVLNRKLELDPALRKRLNENLLLFFTGVTRQAESILTEQQANIQQRRAVLHEMKQMAYIALAELQSGNLDAIGYLLHESWQLKKQLASRISNGALDEMYEAARNAGAIGGKITGAGGGGFLLLYCLHDRQEAVRSVLSRFQEFPFRLAEGGTKVIFNYTQ